MYLYYFYQIKLDNLKDQCFIKSDQNGPKDIFVTEVESNDKFNSTLRPPIYRDIQESGCVCPDVNINTENRDEGLSSKGGGNQIQERSHESSILKCCTANDTTLYEV